MNRAALLVVSVPVLVLAGCMSLRASREFRVNTEALGTQTEPERTVKAMADLQAAEAWYPKDLESRVKAGQKPGDFDPNRYFTVLRHLRMEPGSSLDYAYVVDRDAGGYLMGGYPVLSLQRVEADGTPEGFLELAILQIMGNHFYVFWHALPGKDAVPVCGRQTLGNLLSPLGKLLVLLRCPDAEPQIELEEETATVTLLAFSTWTGLSRRTFVFRRTFPHSVLKAESRCLLYANRHFGVQF